MDDAGRLCIVYWMCIEWRPLAVTLVSSMYYEGADLHTRSRLSCVSAPRFVDDSLEWGDAAVSVRMRRRSSPVATALIDGIRWECVAPAADATFEIDGATLRGAGYAEVLMMSIAPWNLPIQELRWGRFVGRSSSLVWLDWKREHLLTRAFLDGEECTGAVVSDDQITTPSWTLRLDDRTTIRDDSLADTLSAVPLIGRAVPRRFAEAHETKWRSRGTLENNYAGPDDGWVVHEVVRFP